LPFSILVFYVGLSVFLIGQLNSKNEILSRQPATRNALAAMQRSQPAAGVVP
jgi:hypothetical protein